MFFCFFSCVKKRKSKTLSQFYITSCILNPFLCFKKNKSMKQKLFYIVLIIILSFALFVLFRPINKSTPEIQTKTATTYSPGKPKQLYKQGKDSVTTSTKTFHSAITLKPSAEDSTYKYSTADSSCKLSLIIQPAVDGNLALDYFLDLTTKDLVRIDTIIQTRIDTLKIKQTIVEKEDPPFYNTFLFGALTTALVVILLIHFIP